MQFIFSLNIPHSPVIYFWNSISAAAVVAIGAVAITVSTVFVDVISLIIIVTVTISMIITHVDRLLMLMWRLSVYLASVYTVDTVRIPHYCPY